MFKLANGTIYFGNIAIPLSEFLIEEPTFNTQCEALIYDDVNNRLIGFKDGNQFEEKSISVATVQGFIAKKNIYKTNVDARNAPPAPTLNQLKQALKEQVRIEAETRINNSYDMTDRNTILANGNAELATMKTFLNNVRTNKKNIIATINGFTTREQVQAFNPLDPSLWS